MKKTYVAIIALFSLLLLLPFTVQTVADLRGEKRFISLDIFKDVVYTPFVRESALSAGSKDVVGELTIADLSRAIVS